MLRVVRARLRDFPSMCERSYLQTRRNRMLTENDLHAGVTYHSKTQEGLE